MDYFLLADIGTAFTDLFKNMNTTQLILLGIVAFMFLTGKLKIQDLLNLLRPTPTPTPVPVPGPTPDPNPSPTPTPIPIPHPDTPIIDLITQLLPILLPLLIKAKATGNKELEDSVTNLIKSANKS